MRPADRRGVLHAGRPRPTRASPSGSAAPSTSCGRGTTTTRSSRRCPSRAASTWTTSSPGADVVELARATFDGIGLDTAPILGAATSSPATASASTRSASTSTARATCACSPTSSPTPTGWTRCCTSSGTAPTTSGSTPRCRGCSATATSRHRGHRDPHGSAGHRLRMARPASTRRGRGADGLAQRRAAAAAPRLHPLGARDDELRARALRRSRGGSRRALVGAGRPLPAGDAAGRAARTRTGRRRSTSPARPSTTTRISTGTSPPASSGATLDRDAGGSSGGPRRARSSGGGLFEPGQSVRWDALLEQATGEPLTAATPPVHRAGPHRSKVAVGLNHVSRRARPRGVTRFYEEVLELERVPTPPASPAMAGGARGPEGRTAGRGSAPRRSRAGADEPTRRASPSR